MLMQRGKTQYCAKVLCYPLFPYFKETDFLVIFEVELNNSFADFPKEFQCLYFLLLSVQSSYLHSFHKNVSFVVCLFFLIHLSLIYESPKHKKGT